MPKYFAEVYQPGEKIIDVIAFEAYDDDHALSSAQNLLEQNDNLYQITTHIGFKSQLPQPIWDETNGFLR